MFYLLYPIASEKLLINYRLEEQNVTEKSSCYEVSKNDIYHRNCSAGS